LPGELARNATSENSNRYQSRFFAPRPPGQLLAGLGGF